MYKNVPNSVSNKANINEIQDNTIFPTESLNDKEKDTVDKMWNKWNSHIQLVNKVVQSL